VKTITGMLGEWMKENDGGDKFNYDTFDIVQELL
jgi:hypothetical protein